MLRTENIGTFDEQRPVHVKLQEEFLSDLF